MAAPLLNPNNIIITQARSGIRATPIWLAIVLSFAILFLSQFGALPVIFVKIALQAGEGMTFNNEDMDAFINAAMPSTPLEYTVFLISSFMGIYILVWLWVRFYEKRPFQSLGLSWRHAIFRFMRGFMLGALMFIVAVVPASMLGLFTVQDGPKFGTVTIGGVLLILLGWLVQGPAEELLFRGWLMPVISAKSNLWWGIGISSLMFAAAHSLNLGISLLAIANLLLFGIFTALYVLWEKSLWGVFGIHAVWNWVQGNVFGLEVSGNSMDGNSVYVMLETGPDTLTGGPFGPEGGLIVSLVLGIAIGVLFLVNKKSTN